MKPKGQEWTPCKGELVQKNGDRALLSLKSEDVAYAFDVRIHKNRVEKEATDLLSKSNKVDPKEVEHFSVLCEGVGKTSLQLSGGHHMSLAQAVEYLILELSNAIDEMMEDPEGYSDHAFFQNAELRATNTGRI